VSTVRAADSSFKWTLGVTGRLGKLKLAVDYSFSNFNIFSAGLSYTF
jgi:hypothetical protein